MKDPNNIDRIVFIVTLALILLMMHSYSLLAKEKPHYVLVVNNQYEGTFFNCKTAFDWVRYHNPNPYVPAKCLHEDFIYLPQGFEHRYIDLIDMSRMARKPLSSGRD